MACVIGYLIDKNHQNTAIPQTKTAIQITPTPQASSLSPTINPINTIDDTQVSKADAPKTNDEPKTTNKPKQSSQNPSQGNQAKRSIAVATLSPQAYEAPQTYHDQKTPQDEQLSAAIAQVRRINEQKLGLALAPTDTKDTDTQAPADTHQPSDDKN